jgi:alkyl hydroperoxide reductase subunit AhpC
MGKKVYTVNGNLYIIDDETGKIRTVLINDEPIPQRDLDELIKIIMQEAKNKD